MPSSPPKSSPSPNTTTSKRDVWAKPIIIGLLAGLLVIFASYLLPLLKPLTESTSLTHYTQLQSSFRPAIQKAAPAVVNIYTTKTAYLTQHPMFDDPMFQRFLGIQPRERREHMESSLGSGVIADKRGYILTNNHVISEADEIVVALYDGRKVSAQIVGMDRETDLAVLKINLSELPAVATPTSTPADIGDIALAIGNPFGFGQTITMGIVSATGRSGLNLSTYEDFIQTDAAINPGNSGGALINTKGELIGINTAIYSKSGGSQGIGFAIPTHIANTVMEQIIARGAVVRGWLGIIPQAITKNLAHSFGVNYVEGVVIADVFQNSPAYHAGIQPGDILTHIDGKPVEDLRRVMITIAAFQPQQRVTLKLIRRGQSIATEVEIGQRP